VPNVPDHGFSGGNEGVRINVLPKTGKETTYFGFVEDI
jgi:hypothetical protein